MENVLVLAVLVLVFLAAWRMVAEVEDICRGPVNTPDDRETFYRLLRFSNIGDYAADYEDSGYEDIVVGEIAGGDVGSGLEAFFDSFLELFEFE